MRPGPYSRAAQSALELASSRAAETQLRAIVEDEHGVTAKQRMHLLHAVDVHYRGAMHAYEAIGIKIGFDLSHAAPQQVRLSGRVQRHVVIGRFDPVDVLGPDEQHLLAVAHEKSRHTLARRLAFPRLLFRA